MDDPTAIRLGQGGKQRIEDAGTLIPSGWRLWTTNIRDLCLKFIEKAKADNKPFSCGSIQPGCTSSPTSSPKYQAQRNSKNGCRYMKRHGAAR